MKIDYCFHTHTYRCGHATGSDESYVKEAIDAGIKELGFSDHVFLSHHSQPGVRGDFQEFDGYIKSLNILKNKYKNQINIHIGFEAEYFDEYVDYYKSLKEKGIEYLVLGQHFFLNDGYLFYFRNSIDEDNAERYYQEIEKAVKTGLFTYFAHPDLFLTISPSFGKKEEELSRRVCELCKKYDLPIEINLNGMTWTLPTTLTYPCESFWKVAGEVGNKVVIGYDAHQPEFFRETKYINKALEWVKKYNLNLISKEEIIKNHLK